MSAALWLGTYLLHSTVLCGSVVLFRRRLRRMDAAEHLWRAAMLLPLVSATAAHLWSFGPWEIGISARPGAAASLAAEQAASWTAFDIATAAALACFTIGALLALRDWAGHILFKRNLGARTPADPAVSRQVADLLHRKTRRPIVLTTAPGAVGPMVLGRHEICLPARAAHDLTHEQLRALVAHEVAHVIRGDCFWFAAMAYLESALFVQPLNRIGRQELRHLAELSCDDWAARTVSDPLAVAHCLVEVAGWSRRAAHASVPAAATFTKGLTERVQRLLEPRVDRVRVALLPCLLVLCAATLALPQLVVTAQIPTGRSVDYMRGYELGRAYKARYGAEASSSRAQDAAAAAATHRQREELERRLQASQSIRR